MTPDEIKKSSLMKLVCRLYEIDSKLTGENAMLVSEYNQIVEELWNMIPSVSEERKDKPKTLSLTRNKNNA